MASKNGFKRAAGRSGDQHFDTASARGFLAYGLMLAGRDDEALREFKAAIPVMMGSSRENADDDDTTVVAARSQRLQSTVEAYFRLLAKDRGNGGAGDVGAETFGLADAIRGHSVQQALAALRAARSELAALSEFSEPAIEKTLRDLGAELNLKPTQLFTVLRNAASATSCAASTVGGASASSRSRRPARPGPTR